MLGPNKTANQFKLLVHFYERIIDKSFKKLKYIYSHHHHLPRSYLYSLCHLEKCPSNSKSILVIMSRDQSQNNENNSNSSKTHSDCSSVRIEFKHL